MAGVDARLARRARTSAATLGSRLHSATADKDVQHGDAKISGLAVDVVDDASKDDFLRAFEAATGQAPPPGPFDLFRVEVAEVSMLRPGGDHLEIEWWRPDSGSRRVERY